MASLPLNEHTSVTQQSDSPSVTSSVVTSSGQSGDINLWSKATKDLIVYPIIEPLECEDITKYFSQLDSDILQHGNNSMPFLQWGFGKCHIYFNHKFYERIALVRTINHVIMMKTIFKHPIWPQKAHN